MSVLSFPERGHWGDSKWRGNCSGHVYKALFEQYLKKGDVFCDPMVGSGTSVAVAQELGIEAYGLDLHSGFNVLRDSILQTVGKESDMCFSHPAYHDIIQFSGNVWGDKPHPDDLSRCPTEEDFVEKLHIALLNQREATKAGGLYGLLIGDTRKNGTYRSYQADCIARMPKNELSSVVIKIQHNCYTTDNKQYAKMSHMRIQHEYICIWTKPKNVLVSMLSDLATMAKQQQTALTSTWRAVVKNALISLGGQARLEDIYAKVSSYSPEKLACNANWQAKIRQTLQLATAQFKSQERGVWELA